MGIIQLLPGDDDLVNDAFPHLRHHIGRHQPVRPDHPIEVIRLHLGRTQRKPQLRPESRVIHGPTLVKSLTTGLEGVDVVTMCC